MMIRDRCVDNRQYGVVRIHTSRRPIGPIEVSGVLVQMKASAGRLDRFGCLELVQQIERRGAESDRNKKCIVENGAAAALASAFDAFANDSIERNVSVLEGILSALNWMFPLQLEAQKSLGSQASLRCLVWFLKHQDLSGKQKSIIALRELLSAGDQQHAKRLSKIEGFNELLVDFINKAICPTITKASLAVIFHLLSSSSPSSEMMKLSFIELGLVSSLLEILIDSGRSLSEKALGIFDSLCSSEEGREKAYSNALTIPVLVKKILRVSALATDYSVSAIWKLCKFRDQKDEEGRVLVEALHVGAFQKNLLVLQTDCGYETKEKVTELLKWLNPHRGGDLECKFFENLRRSSECIESADVKNPKRSSCDGLFSFLSSLACCLT